MRTGMKMEMEQPSSVVSPSARGGAQSRWSKNVREEKKRMSFTKGINKECNDAFLCSLFSLSFFPCVDAIAR